MLRRAAVQLAHSLQEASALQSARAGPVPAVMHSWLCPTQARQGSSTAPSGAEADPFTAQMQRRTEEELRALLEERTQGDEHDAGEADEAEEEALVSPTGEVGGPRGAYTGAEPTRYGDWERGGRCTDF